MVAVTHSGHEEVRVAVVVDVRERGADANLIGQPEAGVTREVLESPTAQISPQFTPPELRHEVNVVTPVTIHVGDGDPVAVIVMGGLPIFARVVHNPVFEGNSAFHAPVGELEIVEGFELGRGFALSFRARRQQLQCLFAGWWFDRRIGAEAGRHERREEREENRSQATANAAHDSSIG